MRWATLPGRPHACTHKPPQESSTGTSYSREYQNTHAINTRTVQASVTSHEQGSKATHTAGDMARAAATAGSSTTRAYKPHTHAHAQVCSHTKTCSNTAAYEHKNNNTQKEGNRNEESGIAYTHTHTHTTKTNTRTHTSIHTRAHTHTEAARTPEPPDVPPDATGAAWQQHRQT